MNVWWVFGGLVLLVILFMVLWIISETTKTTTIPPSEIEYGVVPNIDGVLLMNCGPDRNQPCLYSTQTLSEAISQCDVLSCERFVFVESTGTMRLVSETGLFSSIGSDIYVKL